MGPTPGIKSTEFLTSLAPMALGIILVLIGALKSQQNLIDAGLYMLLGGSGIYGVSRGLAKLGHGIGGVTPDETPPTDDKGAANVIGAIK